MAQAAVLFGWNQLCLHRAAGDVTHFQEETDRRRRAAEDYESSIAEAQVSLQNLNSKTTGLVSKTMSMSTKLALEVSMLTHERMYAEGLHQGS